MKMLAILLLLAACAGCVNVKVEGLRDVIPRWKEHPEERKGEVKMGGKEMTLYGPRRKAGDEAPNFKAVDGNWKEVELKDFRDSVVLISAVPSVDTKVCSIQTAKFNEEAAKMPDVVLITISHDLPFALERFCEAKGIGNMRVWSDHVSGEFGLKYGVLMKENLLLARSVFVIDRKGKISYMQIVREITNEPDYEDALKAVKKALEKSCD